MANKKESIKELILKNPNDSGNEIYTKIKGTPLGIRKSVFYEIFRDTKNLPEPRIAKREGSIPIKYRTSYQKSKIAKRLIPYEKTKFGKIAKRMEKAHRISEQKAIERARALLKIPRKDYHRLNRKDVSIILSESP